VATALRTAVSCGTLNVAGHQQVNGIDTIKLTSRSNSLLSETIWVSPGTYLPVRVVVHPAAGGPGPRQTADITWLSPTRQNLAELTVPVPAGFRKVSFLQAGTPILRLLPAGLLPKPAALCPSPGPSPAPSPADPACKFGISAPRAFPAPVFKRPLAY
jgi:hypothetical protein